MLETLPQLIEKRLSKLAPTQFILQDDSALHKGHKGNRLGGAHYTLTIASQAFHDLTTLQCHRLIYAELDDLFPAPLHALRINIIR